ncbi:odorant receptor 4-like isoform X2 [Megalopta genalis]|uniref:odorant receptor 4-like isoform X2 n=1 Tax=Megalopta genalis TaxID=115081 RepID=UPI003FD5C38C
MMTVRSTVNQTIKYGLHITGVLPSTPFLSVQKSFWIILMFHPGRLVALITISHSLIHDILSSMEEDCVKYSVVDSENVIPKTADFLQSVIKTIVVMYIVDGSFYAVTTLVSAQINDTLPRRLFLEMDLPFNTIDSPNYEIVVILQMISLWMVAYGYGIFSGLLLMLILHMGCHIDVLCNAMTKIVSSNDAKQLRFVAVRHQELIEFSKQIEELFTFMCFVQMFSNIMGLCCGGYLVVFTLQNGYGFVQQIKFIVSYISMCMEIFIYCFAGEYLNVKNEMIIDAAYQISWYELQPSLRRQVILLLLRSQKGFQLTVGKLSELNLITFTWIVKSSTSYMTVFLAMS